ncbi:TIGR02270 family protein [Vitiosangium sp. GDMCC 1.1324]|uniref:TIGR02270 family protein n=1 Tax=Vitiosangium sp. (strain GDMCC 1.1324) TaxID=2138576 RepID=UPI00130EF107|nr:TIGR02270 family protein [Vitiosangium sp. GDMCC 1.1324]
MLWDVVEEHFQEAAFLWIQRERSLRAPDQLLADIAEGDEHRLVAHLEGLLHAGPRAAERLLVPALRESQAGEVAVAVFALLASEARDWTEAVLAALRETEQPAALLGGVALSPRAAVEVALREGFPMFDTPVQALVLETLALRRADAGGLLASVRTTSEPALLAAALRAARFTDRATALDLVGRGLAHGHPAARDAAIATGCIVGHREAWLRCRRVIEAEPLPRQALLALAAGGEVAVVPLLGGLLARPDLRAEGLWALGLSGRLAAIELLLSLMREGDPAAAEPLALVSGLSLEKLLAPSEDEAEDDASVEAEPDDGAVLPGPVALKGTVRFEVIEGWWKATRPHLSAGGRYLLGRPWSLESLLAALEEAPARRRPGLAWELAVRTRGAVQVEPRAWTWEQRDSLHAAARAATRFQAGPFARFMST